MKNQRLVIYDDGCFGYVGSRTLYAPCELSERDFKKWYNHVLKNVSFADTVLAEYDDEDGSTCELANYWGCEEMAHDPSIPF